jgi:predicted CoA-binding protein
MPSIAIIGASSDPSKFGNKAVKVFVSRGYQVYPVNPKDEIIEGLKVYRTVGEVPEKNLDMISVYLPPPVGLKVIGEIAKKGCKELWLNPGAESPELVEKAESLGLNVIQACSIVGVGG